MPSLRSLARPTVAGALTAAGALAAAGAPSLVARAVAAESRPLVEQAVVFPSGEARVKRVRAAGAAVRVGRRRCAVARGTPLAALLRSRVARLRLRDFGACSRRARDGGGLFVSGIGGVRNAGKDGWVYKVGTRLGTAGAADPSGPFGRGRLRSGARVIWFYCRFEVAAGSCQRTLSTTAVVEPGRVVAVQVLAHDNVGGAVAAEGASVRVGAATAVAAGDGNARVAVPPGSYTVVAEQPGRVRSYPERVVVP